MTQDQHKLEPCPFCGGAASLALCGFGTAKATCMDCGSEGAYSPNREEAIAAWNRRAHLQQRPLPVRERLPRELMESHLANASEATFDGFRKSVAAHRVDRFTEMVYRMGFESGWRIREEAASPSLPVREEPTHLSPVPAEVPAGQVVAWMWQHEETGNVGFIDQWQIENGWEAANPRLRLIRPLVFASREGAAGWIPVSERLPEVKPCGEPGCPWCTTDRCCNSVLVIYKPGHIQSGSRFQTCATQYLHKFNSEGAITHWMPLPSSPSVQNMGEGETPKDGVRAVHGPSDGVVMAQALNALEHAQCGLRWYRDRYPEAADGSDDEADEMIDAAVADLKLALKRADGVNGPLAGQRQEGGE